MQVNVVRIRRTWLAHRYDLRLAAIMVASAAAPIAAVLVLRLIVDWVF